ncbi:hypothetical protein niasHT_018707 [Heterodera trifolii]|uniref:Transposase n=1 Tax=Heterodera trifolii TaxID=157864 RepID=A0ABD2LBC9_9BILA
MAVNPWVLYPPTKFHSEIPRTPGDLPLLVCKEQNRQKSEFSINDSSTKSLIVHLNSSLHKGSEYDKKFQQLEAEWKNAKHKKHKEQPKIVDVMSITSSGTISIVDKKIMHYIICTNASFKSIDHPSLHALMQQEVKCEKHYSLTAHGIDKNWFYKERILAVTNFPGEHTGLAIAMKLRSVLKEWALREQMCIVLSLIRPKTCAFKEVDENGSAILPFFNANCAAHLLNLVVKEGLSADLDIEKLFVKCRKIVGHFKKSNKALGKLHEIQEFLEIPEHCLLQEVLTRWNSGLMMIERLYEQKRLSTNMPTKTVTLVSL